MPLKKPQSVPKIPKARKKNVDVALNSIPAKKPDKIEYTCKALFNFDELTKPSNMSLQLKLLPCLQVLHTK